MLEATNTDLIIRVQKGDPAVIGALYERYHQGVFRYLYYRVGDRQTAEDLTADVFLRMLRFLSTAPAQNGSFQAWLIQIARNLAIDHYRSMNHRNHTQLDDNLVTGHGNPVDASEQAFTSETLQLALVKLPDDQRDTIILRFVSGLPIAQVAQALHKSEDAVKALQRRGLTTLREILSDWEINYA